MDGAVETFVLLRLQYPRERTTKTTTMAATEDAVTDAAAAKSAYFPGVRITRSRINCSGPYIPVYRTSLWTSTKGRDRMIARVTEFEFECRELGLDVRDTERDFEETTVID